MMGLCVCWAIIGGYGVIAWVHALVAALHRLLPWMHHPGHMRQPKVVFPWATMLKSLRRSWHGWFVVLGFCPLVICRLLPSELKGDRLCLSTVGRPS